MSLISQKELEGTIIDYQNKKKLHESSSRWNMSLFVKVKGQKYQKFLSISWHRNEIDIQTDVKSNNYSRLTQVLDRAGLFDLELEFIPSPNLQLKEDKESYNSERFKNKTLRKRMETFNPYGDWLKEIINLFDNPQFIPDTNFLCRQYYSHFLKSIMSTLISEKSVNQQLKIGLARLTILELERWKEDGKQKLAFLSMGEMLSVKNESNSWLLPQLEGGMVESFSRIAGSKYADSFIRKEISKYPDSFLLTSDLMNAFAANAENFNVIFFTRIRHMKNSSNILEKLTSLIYNFSIEFDECRVELDNLKKLNIKGMWEGKTPDIWKNNMMEVTFLT